MHTYMSKLSYKNPNKQKPFFMKQSSRDIKS